MDVTSQQWILRATDFKPTAQKEVTLVKPLATFSWIDSSTPRILVPGAPKIYHGRRPTHQLAKDGESFIDENHYRQPYFPLESLFRSVSLCSPEFKYDDVDFVTDRNNLRKLVRFLGGGKDNKDFEIRLNRRSKTILFTRVEPKDQEQGQGYGIAFEKAISTSKNSKTTSFRRVVCMQLGALKLIIRTEVDAVAENNSPTKGKVDELTDSLANLSLTSDKWKTFEESKLEYMFEGPMSTNFDMVEFKTKSVNFAHEFDYRDTYFQMAFGGVDKGVFGFHQRGLVSKIEICSLPDIAHKAADRGKVFDQLEKLLAKIKEIGIKECEESKTLQMKYQGSNLVIQAYDGPSPIPQSFVLPA